MAEITAVEIKRESEIREPHYGYHGMTIEEAVKSFAGKFGFVPGKVYTKGKNVYIVIPIEHHVAQRAIRLAGGA